MSDKEKRQPRISVQAVDDDDRELVALGYKPSFKREFSNLATVRFFFHPFTNYRAHTYFVQD